MTMTDAAPLPGENEDLVLDLNEPEEKTEKTEKTAKPPPVPGPSTVAAAPETGLADLEKQIENVRRERDQQQALTRRMQQERDQWAAYAQEAERRGVSALEVYADTKIQGIQEQMEALAAQQEGALSDGDFKNVAQINLKLNKLGGELAMAERDKSIAGQQREQLQRRGQQPQRTQQQPQQLPSDPLERAIVGRTEKTKSFIRAHPELVRSDGSLKRIAMEAHEKALDEGYSVDSDGYFRHIESTLAGAKASASAEPVTPESARPAPAYAAPASRNASPAVPGMHADGRFTMSQKMRKLAAEAGVTEQEWAANYVRLVKEGRVTPIT